MTSDVTIMSAAEGSSEPPAPARSDANASDATRYLCAAAYLDDAFARRVLDEVLYTPHRALAPAYGVGPVTVVRHCVGARRRILVRDGVLTAIIVVLFLVNWALSLGFLVTLFGTWLFFRGVRLLVKRDLVGAIIHLLGSFVTSWTTFGLVIAALGLASSPTTRQFDPYTGTYVQQTPQAVLDALGLARWWPLVIFAFWLTYLVHRLGVHRTIVDRLAAGRFRPESAPTVPTWAEDRLTYMEDARKGNVTVYSEEPDVRPFVGSGLRVNEWSVAVPLVPQSELDLTGLAREKHPTTTTLTAETLYEACRRGLVRLARPGSEETPLGDFSIQDRICVAGLLPPSSPLLDDRLRPWPRVTREYVDWVASQGRGPQRHYQTTRMTAWGGEVEVTTFLHIAVRGGMLYVEFVATMLPSIAPRYHRIDTYERLDLEAIAWAVVRSVRDVFAGAPLAPYRMGREAIGALFRSIKRWRQGHSARRQLGYDYGARTSIRELGVDWDADAKFQWYDGVERISIVSRRLLETIVDTARAHGLSVTDLELQATMVINNFNLKNSVVGSTIHPGAALAFGTGAQASTAGVPAMGAAAAVPPVAG